VLKSAIGPHTTYSIPRRVLANLKSVYRKKLSRFQAKRIVQQGLFDQIDWKALTTLRSRFDGHPYTKFYDYKDKYLLKSAKQITRLGLHKSKGLRILDLGCGFGYFIYAAEHLGHQTMGLDLDDPLMNEVAAVLGLKTVKHGIAAFQPLPKIPGGPFDLVTAFKIVFNRDNLQGLWASREWCYFLKDVSRFMAPGCILSVKFNFYPEEGRRSGHGHEPLPEALRDYFLSVGGEFDKKIMEIRNANMLVSG
jgi:SAM-dependent methyltransferase